MAEKKLGLTDYLGSLSSENMTAHKIIAFKAICMLGLMGAMSSNEYENFPYHGTHQGELLGCFLGGSIGAATSLKMLFDHVNNSVRLRS